MKLARLLTIAAALAACAARDRLPLRNQHISLSQLGDDLFRLVTLPWHGGPPSVCRKTYLRVDQFIGGGSARSAHPGASAGRDESRRRNGRESLSSWRLRRAQQRHRRFSIDTPPSRIGALHRLGPAGAAARRLLRRRAEFQISLARHAARIIARGIASPERLSRLRARRKQDRNSAPLDVSPLIFRRRDMLRPPSPRAKITLGVRCQRFVPTQAEPLDVVEMGGASIIRHARPSRDCLRQSVRGQWQGTTFGEPLSSCQVTKPGSVLEAV